MEEKSVRTLAGVSDESELLSLSRHRLLSPFSRRRQCDSAAQSFYFDESTPCYTSAITDFAKASSEMYMRL